MTAQSEIINLPEDYFLRSVWQAYGNPREALIRELLQNAVDAGATDIRFTLTDKTITIDDDGVGMTEEIIRPALLTLNGSYKRAGSAGGFGAAKELIILAHSNYEVLTNDVVVRGQNIRFTLSRADQPRKGTRITIEPHARFEYGLDSYLALAREYLATCDVAPRIYLNGELQRGLSVERVAVTLPWGCIRMKQLRGETRDQALVRVHGITMFRRYISAMKKLVVVEIERPSTEVLTSNRDSFTYSAARDFDQQITVLAIDKESFGRKKGGTAVVAGQHSYYLLLRRRSERFQQVMVELKSHLTEPTLMAHIERVFTAGDASSVGAALTRAVATLQASGETRAAETIQRLLQPDGQEESLEVAFAIHYGDYDRDSLPEYFQPAKIGPRLRTLVHLWRAAIQEVGKLVIADGAHMQFRVGWTFERLDEEPLPAAYAKEEGIDTFLINPQCPQWRQSPRQYLPTLLSVAAHELLHQQGLTYHDEAFAARLTMLEGKLLGCRGLMGRVRAKAKITDWKAACEESAGA
jgi:hypothetical protein